MGQKWFFNKCFSWTGPGLCSSRLPPLPLPFFPLALRFLGNFVLSFFSFSVVEIWLSGFYFLFKKYALRFFVFRFEILLSGFHFLFWKFCSQGFIFYFESFALRSFIFHFENFALLFSFSTFAGSHTLLSNFHLLFYLETKQFFLSLGLLLPASSPGSTTAALCGEFKKH